VRRRAVRAHPCAATGLRAAASAGLVLLVLAAPATLAAPASAATGGASSSTAGAAAAAPLPQPQQDPATSRARADEILSRPEFHRPAPSLMTRVTRWLGEAVGRLITGLVRGGVGSAIAWGILALNVGLLVLLVARITRTVQAEPSRGGPAVHVEVRRSPREWRHEAEACEARGAWKDALRCRYRALIGDLVARRVVRDLPGRTTGEYRADVAAALPAAAPDFAGASELFERAWYGDQPTGAAENERFRALSDHVVERAGRPARAVAVDLEDVPA